jgi:hypothetical protein
MSFQADQNTLTVPRGTPGAGLMILDLAEVRQLEARKEEVVSVTKAKAPELMRAMEKGYTALVTQYLPMVGFELSQAEQATEERKAVVMLDEAPRILSEKGLTKPSNPSGTADQRENVLALDKEYKALRNTVEMLKAVEALLKGKAKGFEMSYQSVKKVYDNLDNFGVVRNFHTPIPDSADVGDEITSTGALKIGTPRY